MKPLKKSVSWELSRWLKSKKLKTLCCLGEHGHIAIATNDIHRAITYLKMKGISLLPETAKEKDGKLKAIYLDQEVSGFAIHLLQK